MTWHAHMIAADPAADADGAPLLIRQFHLDSGHGHITNAALTVTAFGLVEPWLNGHRVTEDLLLPGWTSYEWRLRHATYDVTANLESTSTIVLALGNGWYRGRLGWTGGRALYGDELGAFAQLLITYQDGHTQTVVTDETWQSARSNTLANDFYDGQHTDTRLPGADVVSKGSITPAVTGTHRIPFDRDTLTAYDSPRVRRVGVLAPARIWESPSGRTLIDFGENLVGWVRIKVRGAAGDELIIRHAEVLEHGELGTRPLRSAAATDRFILNGAEQLLEPTMTLHGFRYVEITGTAAAVAEADVEAVIVSSDLRRIGTFHCSDPLLNQLHANVVRGMRGNFVDVPTDCPQRDERLGWTGDLAVFAPTAAFLYDIGAFLDNWMRDLRAEQRHHDDVVPFVVPDALKFLPPQNGIPDEHPTAIWGDSAVWVPWALWQAYGNPTALRRQYPTMATHLRSMRARLSADGLGDRDFQFGDWLDPDAPADDPTRAKTDPFVVATACGYRSAVIGRDAATILGHDDDAAEFDELATRMRAAFNRHYVTDDGRIRSDSSTAYALAIAFAILDEPTTRYAGDRLAALVEASDFRISTGFAGTPYITDALTRTGHTEHAYRLLQQTELPSWLYPVTMGATTIWERWDSMLPDGTINPGDMTSFNHYALGAVADWMHRTIAGISPLQPGYRSVLIAPIPGGTLTAAEATVHTPAGTVAASWTRNADTVTINVELPDNITGILRLPAQPDRSLRPGRTSVTVPNITEPTDALLTGY